MASSNAGQQQQAPKWGKDGLLDCSFASYLELRKDPNFQPPVLMHSSLLRPFPFQWLPFRCSHCKREDLRRPASSATPEPNAWEHAVPLPDAEQVAAATLDELALEGRSCFRCAEEICKKTRYLQEAVPAGFGGDTPLHHAVRSGNLRMLCHLLTLVGDQEGGHDSAVEALRKQNERGETALYAAVIVGDIDIVKLLMWVDPHLGQIPCRDDTSPIYLAVSVGRIDIAEALHDAPGAILSYSGPDGQNALHAAALQGGEMTKRILTWNKDLIQMKDKQGRSPLHVAVSVVQHPIISGSRIYWRKASPTYQLMDADSSMAYVPDGEGLFPLHIAAMRDHRYAVHLVLTMCPACMGLRDKQGRTFLHVAAQNKAGAVVNYACYRPGKFGFGSITNIQDNNGNTALHLAVEATHLGMVSALMSNRRVCLNLMNNKGQTPLDVAKSRIRQGFFFVGNPDKVIYNILARLGAKHGRDEENKQMVSAHDLDDEKEESDKLTSSTQVLGIGSALIATVTFGATFTLPGGNIADDHTNGGTPTLARRWYFDAFVVANTLAFIYSSVATVGLMYSGRATVSLPARRLHFNVSVFFLWTSITCLTAAYALGVYLLLAPVARPTAIAICYISPLVLVYVNVESLRILFLSSGPLRSRRGFRVWLMTIVSIIFRRMLIQLWPFAIIFGWAAQVRDRRHG